MIRTLTDKAPNTVCRTKNSPNLRTIQSLETKTPLED